LFVGLKKRNPKQKCDNNKVEGSGLEKIPLHYF
jgi:hypothetical protein